MEEYELYLLLVFAALVAAKVLQQAARLCKPVRVPPFDPPPGADAVQAARDAAEWALYAKAGRPPACKRLGLTLGMLGAVAACVPVWWRLTQARDLLAYARVVLRLSARARVSRCIARRSRCMRWLRQGWHRALRPRCACTSYPLGMCQWRTRMPPRQR
jgi:hypothetical protein